MNSHPNLRSSWTCPFLHASYLFLDLIKISLSSIPPFSSLPIYQPVFTSAALQCWPRGPSLNFLLHLQLLYPIDIIFSLTWQNRSCRWFQPVWFLPSYSQTSKHGKKRSYSSADWSHCKWTQGLQIQKGLKAIWQAFCRSLVSSPVRSHSYHTQNFGANDKVIP